MLAPWIRLKNDLAASQGLPHLATLTLSALPPKFPPLLLLLPIFALSAQCRCGWHCTSMCYIGLPCHFFLGLLLQVFWNRRALQPKNWRLQQRFGVRWFCLVFSSSVHFKLLDWKRGVKVTPCLWSSFTPRCVPCCPSPKQQQPQGWVIPFSHTNHLSKLIVIDHISCFHLQ